MGGGEGVRDLAAEGVIVGSQRIGVQRQEVRRRPGLPGHRVHCSPSAGTCEIHPSENSANRLPPSFPYLTLDNIINSNMRLISCILALMHDSFIWSLTSHSAMARLLGWMKLWNETMGKNAMVAATFLSLVIPSIPCTYLIVILFQNDVLKDSILSPCCAGGRLSRSRITNS